MRRGFCGRECLVLLLKLMCLLTLPKKAALSFVSSPPPRSPPKGRDEKLFLMPVTHHGDTEDTKEAQRN